MKKSPSLTPSELLSIDRLITRAQEKGLTLKDQVKTSITDAQAQATPDAHHPLFDISEHDQHILAQIVQLTSKLEHSVSLGELIELRGQLVRKLSQS